MGSANNLKKQSDGGRARWRDGQECIYSAIRVLTTLSASEIQVTGYHTRWDRFAIYAILQRSRHATKQRSQVRRL